MNVKNQIKQIIPDNLWKVMHNTRQYLHEYKEVMRFQHRYSKTIMRLKNKPSPLNVLFLAMYRSSWKYDSVFQMMQNDTLFNPLILVCPDVLRGKEHMLETLNECCDYFKAKQYPYICTYNSETDEYVDALSYQPDIVFFTNPYESMMDSRYRMNQFKNSLLCYVNYGFINVKYRWSVNLLFHQCLWRWYVDCEDNKKLIGGYSITKGKNLVVTGYPMYDAFTQGTNEGKDWKIQSKTLKRVIWAPHHSIYNPKERIQYSTFERYYDYMWQLSQKYQETIQFVFKPHPLLKVSLYQTETWGKNRTDAYYDLWKNGRNTNIEEGEYVDLFNSSDALIHDCASFMLEYLYQKKPVLYLANSNRQKDSTEAALKAYNVHYMAENESDIELFLQKVILDGEDTLAIERETVYREVLLPPHGITAAENIINDIKSAIQK